jgi:hypothetical protein
MPNWGVRHERVTLDVKSPFPCQESVPWCKMIPCSAHELIRDLGAAKAAIPIAKLESQKRPRLGALVRKEPPPFYAACAVCACWLTSDSAIWLSVLSVFFSSFSVSSSSLTASL